MIRAAAILLSIAIVETAAACKCGGIRPLTEARKQAVYVVTGVVTAAHQSVISSRRLTDSLGDLPLLLPVTNIEIAVTRPAGAEDDRADAHRMLRLRRQPRAGEGVSAVRPPIVRSARRVHGVVLLSEPADRESSAAARATRSLAGSSALLWVITILRRIHHS